MTHIPRQTYTRGRAVEYMAYHLLLSKGYHAVLCAGTTTPVDLVAWRCGGQQILIKTERARTKIQTPTAVAGHYAGDLAALRAMVVPPVSLRQFWIWDVWYGWRFFEVMAGGICEVNDV